MQILSIRDKQIVCIANNLILFYGKNKKNIINLLSAEFAQKNVKA